MGEISVNNAKMGSDVDISKKVKINMILLLLGRIVSLFGSKIYSFAMGLYVLKTTGSGTSFSLTLVFSLLPAIILSPFAGILADKVNRKRMVVIMDILSGVVVLLLFMLASVDGLRVSYIYGASFLLAVCSTFFDTPFMAAIPNIVDDSHLMKANSLSHVVTQIAAIGGPFLGGMIYAIIDIKLFLIVNGLSFILSGISEMFIDFNLNKSEEKKESDDLSKCEKVEDESNIKSTLRQIKEGFVYLKSKSIIFVLVIFLLFLNFFVCLGMTVPYNYIITKVIQLSPKQIGTLQGVFPVGALVGAVVLSIVPKEGKNYKKLIFGIVIFNLGIITMGVLVISKFMVFDKLTYFILYMIIMFIMGIANTIINIPATVTIQRETEDEYRGRVFSLLTMIGLGIAPIGFILSGIFMDILPPYILPVFSGIVLMILTFFMAKNKDIKEF